MYDPDTTEKKRRPKSIPDRVLKGAILSSLVDDRNRIPLELTLSQIHVHISTVPYFCESPEVDVETGEPTFSQEFIYDNKDGVRKELTYLRQAGYISKLGDRKPHTYRVTLMGAEHAIDTFAKYRVKKEQMEKTATLMARSIIENSEEFQEAVREYVRTNQIPKLNITRTKAPIIKNPRVKTGKGEKITFVNEDSSEQEITTEELQAALLKVDGIRIKEEEHKQILITQQQEMAGYQQQIADLVYALDGKEITISDIKRRNTGAIRIVQRKDLVFAVSGVNPDELNYELPVEIPIGADFLNAWGSIWGRKVKGATLFKRASFELMADTNPEVGRGHANYELNYDQMDAIGMFISKIRPTGITVNAFNERMSKPIALVW